MIDPLDTLQIDVQGYGIKSIVSVYADSAGERWWTTAWFNGREKSEPSIEIPRRMAVSFIQNQISKYDWLVSYFPMQMNSGFNVIEKIRRNLFGI